MLFYVIAKPKGEGPPPTAPPKEFVELVVKEWEHVIGLMEEGKVAAAYGYQDKPGGFMICNVESREDLEELFETLPMYEHAVFEVAPLLSAVEALERAKQGRTVGPT
jgi:hypothetical protein